MAFMPKKVRLLVQTVISCGLLVWLFSLLPADTWSSLRHARPAWIGVAICSLFTCQVIGALRLYSLVRDIVPDLTFFSTLRGTFLGYFCSSFLPASIGGDVVKLAWLTKRAGHGGELLAGMVVERLINFSITLLIVAFSCRHFMFQIDGEQAGQWGRIFLAGVLLGLFLLFLGVFWLKKSRSSWRMRFVQLLASAQAALRYWRKTPFKLILCGVYSTTIIALSCFGAMVPIAWAVGMDLAFLDAAAAISLGLLLVLFPLSFNGIGVYEAGLTGIFVLLGYPLEQGVQVAVLLRLAGTLIAFPGVVCFISGRR